jgi:hypothetical protein
MQDYGKTIANAKRTALDALNARENEMDPLQYALLLRTIEDIFSFDASGIQDEKNFIKQLDELTSKVVDLVRTDPNSIGPVSQLIEKKPYDQGAINAELMKEFNYDGLLMVGSLIDVSSPQCRYVANELGGRIKRSDWPKLKSIAEKHGLMEGTTFDNLPKNKLHRQCRHEFVPIIIKKSTE